jgi:hypothetical protein
MRRGVAGRAAIAAGVAAGLVAYGCGSALKNGFDRSEGYRDSSYPLAPGPVSDVPVRGHQVHIERVAGGAGSLSGELIAASPRELTVDVAGGRRERVAVEEISLVSIELYPSHAGEALLITVAAIGIGIAGIASVGNHDNGFARFLGGWGIIWIPFGLVVGIPTVGGMALNARHQVAPGTPEFGHLYKFARYPQGEPGSPSLRPPRPPPSAVPAPYDQPPAAGDGSAPADAGVGAAPERD